MVAHFVDVSIFADPPQVDEFGECLFRDAVNVHTLLRNEARQFLELFGWTFGIGAVQRLGAARLADGDLGRCMTDGTLSRHAECAYTQGDLIIFNQDVPTTITTSAIDKIDNTESVTPDNVCALSNKSVDMNNNTFTQSAYVPTTNANITIDKIKHIVFNATSTQTTYNIGNAPYAGYELRITVASNAKTVTFLSGGQTVTKTLSVGVHHLTWQDATGWAFYELSGEYYNETTFTFLI